jgi:hypothetical protein
MTTPPWGFEATVTPWAGFKQDTDSKQDQEVTWLPRWGEEEAEVKREPRRFPDAGGEEVKRPDAGEEERKEEREQGNWNWWQRMQKTVFKEVLAGKEEAGREGKRRKRITPGNYTAMEIHGFFGLVDDGRCGQGRMLICHVPSWVKGQFMDLRDGDRVHVWNVNGRGKGVLSVLSTGRHRYYSPGSKVTTCTICVPEEEWARVVG